MTRDERLLTILLSPVISEKSTVMAEGGNVVVFKVRDDATKLEIKDAVELLFDDVKVSQVRTVNIKGKRKMFKGRPGKRNDVKKAYITLAEGADIELGVGA